MDNLSRARPYHIEMKPSGTCDTCEHSEVTYVDMLGNIQTYTCYADGDPQELSVEAALSPCCVCFKYKRQDKQ